MKTYHSNHQSAIVSALNRIQAIIEFDLNGKILDANDLFLSVMGYSLDELVGQHHRMFCEESYANSPSYTQFWNELGQGATYTGEFRRFGKDHRSIWLSASYNPVLDEVGNPIRIVKFATDVTATKLQQAESNGKLDAISRSQAVIEFDLAGNVLTANSNFLRVMG